MSLDLDPAPLAGTAVAAGALLPDVTLTEAGTGQDWRPSQLRQRAAQVLCFMHDECPACADFLERLADRREDLAWSDTQVRVVGSRPTEGPFPVLLDPHATARQRILGPAGQVPTLVVADRYTAVTEAHPAPDHDFPDPEDLLTSLRLLACDCE